MFFNLSLQDISLLFIQFAFVPGAVYIITFAILYPIQDIVSIANDEGFLLHPADRIFNGEMPYFDFRRTYPPGRAYLLSRFFRRFGLSWYTAKMGFLLSFCFLMSLLYLSAAILTGSLLFSLFSWAAALCYLFPCHVLYHPVYIHSTMNADRLCTSFLAILFFFIYCKTSAYIFLSFAGFLAGITFALGQEIALCISFSMFIAVFFKGYNIKAEMFYMSAGLILSLILWYTALKNMGMTLAKLWEYDFKDIFTYIKKTRLPYPELFFSPGRRKILWGKSIGFDRLLEIFHVQRFFLPWLFYLILTLFYLFKRTGSTIVNTDMMVVQILLFGIFFLSYLVQRADYEHLAVSLTPFYVIYAYGFYKAATFFEELYAAGIRDLMFWGISYILTVFFIITIYDFVTASLSYSREREAKSLLTLMPLERSGVYFNKETAEQLTPLIEWITNHTKGNDYIFVCPSEPHIYFLTGRRNPTKIISILPQIHPDDVSEMIYDLEQKRPEYIVYNKDLVNASYQNGMHLKEYAPSLHRYIWECYERKIDIKSYIILKRKKGEMLHGKDRGNRRR